ncbi:isoleucine--tRNA ligase [Persicitalea jodogahamensis]|uniref:Isoleucine--tRNA ligase n=1 Tax=Persicitalea jodogahamensis TaxID=402147 RepID=A0A8J3D457_9BACT|nr:isoleucine--tRNA ligase [Persicitalea jodogahamensis]GHB72009.1 isoleucine--tRNA ligase [Persicitalea jodogahamensis]
MKYQEYKNLSYPQIADEVLDFWKENKTFEASVAIREGQPTFTFYEGPPSANGAPGIHHVMARTIKDIFCRYKTLRGFQVKRKGGWDTHGLPIELQVEKELGITKEDIGTKISIEEYNAKCRETVMRFTSQWNDLTEKMGYWVDLEDPYVTYENNYIESLWNLLKKLYDKGLLYKGYTIQPYSPAAGTGLSSHELNMPGTYKELKDTTIVAMFKVKAADTHSVFKDFSQEDVRILAWTTTPWTLPANSALTVGANIDYVLVKTFNPYTYDPVSVVLAKDLVSQFFSEKGRDGDFEGYGESDKKILPWQVLAEFKGKDLEGIEYEQLLPYVQPKTPAFRVILGDFVTTEDGTGVVHTSPTFGADDFRVAQANGIPPIMVQDENGKDVPIVDRQGRFVQEIGEFGGRYVKPEYYSDEEQADPDFKPTDVLIAIKLKEEGKAFKVEKYEHPYPHCWRTDKPVLYYPLDSWFIRTTAMKEKLVALNKTINWQPESTGTGRFGNWLENLVDWNLSRSRYWGTPLPIWRSEQGEEVCIGSVEELVNLCQVANGKMREWTLEGKTGYEDYIQKNDAFLQASLEQKLDLHRPFVDEVFLISESGQLMQREADLIDVWFDSGAMPYAQWHYPFENHEIFNESFPADFISEGVDQTRGWFFTLHAIAGMLFDSVAFKNVVSTGLVLDKNGNKMSKRLGNAVNPFETLATYGPDATRWYLITNAEPWDNLKFNIDGIGEVQRKFFGTLSNTYNFFALYANLDGYQINQFDRIPHEKLPELDRWILSKLNTLVKEVGEQFENYNPTKAGRLVQDFVCDQLSNWYVRLSRRRFWTGSTGSGQLTPDKQAAYETLQHCLSAVAQLMSPIAPFFGDWLYKNLTDATRQESVAGNTPFQHESVHLTNWHPVEYDWIDLDLEESMQLAQDISSLVHSLRKGHKIKVRQPLSKILIPVLSEKTRRQIENVAPIILSEVNIKTVEFVSDDSGILKKKIKPNFKALGPKFGPRMKEVAAAISKMSEEDIKVLERDNEFPLALASSDAPTFITLHEVEITAEDVPGWLVASEDGLTVALDVTVTEDLRKEGIARDFVNRIQNLRKDSGFDVTDKIQITLQNDDATLTEAVASQREYICQEVQAVGLELVPDLNGAATEIEMDEFLLKVKVEVV